MSGSEAPRGAWQHPTEVCEKRLESVDGSFQAILTCSHGLEEPGEEERQRRPRARVQGEHPRSRPRGCASGRVPSGASADNCEQPARAKTRLLRGPTGVLSRNLCECEPPSQGGARDPQKPRDPLANSARLHTGSSRDKTSRARRQAVVTRSESVCSSRFQADLKPSGLGRARWAGVLPRERAVDEPLPLAAGRDPQKGRKPASLLALVAEGRRASGASARLAMQKVVGSSPIIRS
jgi:hypothetical protein